jgi:undecaprenyl-diphosphatase
VLWTLTGATAAVLALRRRWRLAAYLLVTGAGELVLDPVLKALVGRLRPVVAHPIAHGNGDSFPSGHALGSIVCYGALLLVFLPAARGKRRRALTAVIVTLIVVIGISRLLLGVHYLSDVLGAWALGISWLGVTAFAFEVSRQVVGKPVTDPVTEGLEPEARDDLQLAEPETTARRGRARGYGRIAAGALVAWVLIVGALTGIGKLIMITGNGSGNLLGDHAIPHWLAARRTPALTHWSLIASNLGATQDILIVGVATCVVFIAVTRHWRPVTFLATVMAGELAAFLIIEAVVKRPRPDVPHLDSRLPTSAFPSGHVAATACLYIGIAILVIGHCRGWWRYLFLIPAIVMPVMIAVARLYRGEHHPTDVLASVLFAALWLTATTMAIKPSADGTMAIIRYSTDRNCTHAAFISSYGYLAIIALMTAEYAAGANWQHVQRLVNGPAYIIAGLIALLVIAGVIAVVVRLRKPRLATQPGRADDPVPVGRGEQRRED